VRAGVFGAILNPAVRFVENLIQMGIG
jgi:hypothetical protein